MPLDVLRNGARCVARCAAVAALLAAPCLGQQVSLEFLSDINIVTGTPFKDVDSAPAEAAREPLEKGELSGSERLRRKIRGGFGGLSAIAYDARDQKLYALSDASKPTIYVLRASFEGTALRLKPLEEMLLRDEQGEPLPLWVLDPEGLALSSTGELYVSSEGYGQRTPPVPPGVFRFNREGRMLESLPLPPGYAPNGKEGVRTNLGFEALTLTPSGDTLFAGTEGPLAQDGERCSATVACRIRIVEFKRSNGRFEPAKELTYALDKMPVPAGFVARSGGLGFAEMLALDERRLLTLERGFAVEEGGGVHQTIQIYQTEIDGDALGEKTLVLDVQDVIERFTKPFQSLDNFEGMCFGPALADGGRTVLLVSDDNYNERQRTSFLAFRLTEPQP